jgi:SPP1 gp7 family putative phage head morphogenesis protein
VKDPESFRHAGSRVFSKVQYRIEVFARTEMLRAHNQGRIKFHRRVRVWKLEWMTMEDEWVCPACGSLDGKVFDTDRFPPQPAPPNWRCTSIVAWPLEICGGELGVKAAAAPAACILSPQAIEEQAKAKEEGKLKVAFESGQIADLNTLTVKQLQTLAKQNGVSIARTKAEFIKLLDQVEPGMDHSNLSGKALVAAKKKHHIGPLKNKQQFIKPLQKAADEGLTEKAKREAVEAGKKEGKKAV